LREEESGRERVVYADQGQYIKHRCYTDLVAPVLCCVHTHTSTHTYALVEWQVGWGFGVVPRSGVAI